MSVSRHSLSASGVFPEESVDESLTAIYSFVTEDYCIQLLKALTKMKLKSFRYSALFDFYTVKDRVYPLQFSTYTTFRYVGNSGRDIRTCRPKNSLLPPFKFEI